MSKINIEFVGRLLADIDEAINIILSDASKPFNSLSRPERSEIRYYVIVLVEALMALALHLARRMYFAEPETPVSAFKVLVDKGLMADTEFNDAVKLVRLRNLIVHRYWAVDDKLIYESIREDFKNIRSFTNRIRDRLEV